MSHLAEEYAKCCGVKIGKPVLKPHYFPVLYDKYITIHNDKKVQAKEYDMWPDVIKILKKYLGDIKIIQIGAQGEETIQGVDKHMPTASLKQSSYIIDKGLGHLGIDSVPVHIASALDKPVVGIYAHTYANTCKPLWNDKSKSIQIESHRNGRKPSFSLEEHPKTINLIKPEEIAQAVLDVLDINKTVTHKTIFIGDHYTSNFVEVIPSQPTTVQAPLIDVRMDICHNEEVLGGILGRNDVEVTTNKPISLPLLDTRKIKKIVYKSDFFDVDFCEAVKSRAIPISLECRSSDHLKKQRARLFDCMINLLDENEIIKKNKKRLPEEDLGKINIASNKKVVCGDEIYESIYHLNDKKNSDDFYLDLDFYRVYTDSNE
tara:strand:+ start:2255 stop:3379 length:1125 start_codon:yes stop_codon:yes gene_type:complete